MLANGESALPYERDYLTGARAASDTLIVTYPIQEDGIALTPDLETAVGTSGLARLISAALQTTLALLVASGIGAGAAIRTNAVPPFNWQFRPDSRHILAIQDGPVCQAMPGIPAGACADYLHDLRKFTITYRAPQTNWVLLSALLPEPYRIAGPIR